jgi:hypothetical protein
MSINDAADWVGDQKPPTALARHERNTELPLMVLSLAVIPLAAVELLEPVKITYTPATADAKKKTENHQKK